MRIIIIIYNVAELGTKEAVGGATILVFHKEVIPNPMPTPKNSKISHMKFKLPITISQEANTV